MPQRTEDDVRRTIGAFKHWYHTIEVAPGICTPGCQNSPAVLTTLEQLGLPSDLAGKRVLDVGARDGFFSFAAEKRGADVVAVDYAEPSVTGFGIAAELLGSRVPYHVDNVYDLSPEKTGLFDVILFLGVIYHLRNPMLALDRLRSLCKPDALLLIETALLPTPLTERLSRLKRLGNLLLGKKEAETGSPLWQFAPGTSLNHDGTNCWVPSMEGLKAAVCDAEFKVLASRAEGGRGLLAARAHADPEAARFRELDGSKALFQNELKR